MNESQPVPEDSQSVAEQSGTQGSSPRTWSEKLREPFSQDQVMYKPVVWCADCRKAAGKVCGIEAHKKVKCGFCDQTITTAHVDLDFVGHADVTDRLNSVDPNWDWRPASRAVDKELLTAAVATGDSGIVRMVIDNAPPLRDEFGGMWAYLTLHDDDGQPVTRLCYGDAENKTGPNAVKEVIGDSIRNGAMRFGVAWYLWSRADHAELRAERLKLESTGTSAARSRAARQATTRTTATEALALSDISEQQSLANAAAAISADPKSTVDGLAKAVYEVARRRKLLVKDVTDPWDKATIRKLTDVISEAKRKITERG